jgi:hypothetical protein
MVLVAAILLRLAYQLRTVEPGNYHTPIPGVFMLFSALACFGFGLVLSDAEPVAHVARGARVPLGVAWRSGTPIRRIGGTEVEHPVSVVRAPMAAGASVAVAHPSTAAGVAFLVDGVAVRREAGSTRGATGAPRETT